MPCIAAADYLNDVNISVSLGSSMSAEPFANRSAADSLASVIDADSASDHEFHLQTTHVWVSGGQLELVFDFPASHDLTGLHFWNYTGEAYDVDNIVLDFLDSTDALIFTETIVDPALGISGPVLGGIYAETFPLAVEGVRSVRAVVSGSNDQVDFQNIGFTGVRTTVEPPVDVDPVSGRPVPSVTDHTLSWAPVTAMSINVHDGNGAYLRTLPGDATSWTAPGPGDYYLVATNEGDWRTWARSETVTVAGGDGSRAPMPSVTGHVLSWAAVPAMSINVHDGSGAYLRTLPGDATSWTAPGPGDYYLVATNEGDWRTWARSKTVTVGGS